MPNRTSSVLVSIKTPHHGKSIDHAFGCQSRKSAGRAPGHSRTFSSGKGRHDFALVEADVKVAQALLRRDGAAIFGYACRDKCHEAVSSGERSRVRSPACITRRKREASPTSVLMNKKSSTYRIRSCSMPDCQRVQGDREAESRRAARLTDSSAAVNDNRVFSMSP